MVSGTVGEPGGVSTGRVENVTEVVLWVTPSVWLVVPIPEPGLRRRAGERARRRAETFSIETMRRRTEELYLELVEGKARRGA